MEKPLFKQQTLSRVSFYLAIFTLTLLVLRFFIIVEIADKFGAGEIADVLFFAQLIPVSLFLQNRKALFLSVVPVYTEYVVKGDEKEIWNFISQFSNFIVLVSCCFMVLYFLGAPYLMRILTPGFTPDQHELTIRFTRLLCPAMLFFMIFAVQESLLYCHKHYTTTSWANLFGGVGGLLGVVFLTDRYGLFGYGYGSLAGYLLQIIIPMSLFWAFRKHYVFSLDLKHPGLVKVYNLLLPVYLFTAVLALIHITNRTLATTLGPGRVSAYQYCSTLTWLLPIVITNSILAPLFPTMSEKAIRNDIEGLKELMCKATQVLFFAVAPVVFVLIILRGPIIQFIFERGKFTPEDTAMTAYALLFYAPFILAMSLNFLYSQMIINLKLLKTAAKLGLILVGLNLAYCFVLMKRFDVGGITLATTITFFIQTVVSILLIRHRIGAIGMGRLIKPGIKVLCACVLSAIFTYYLYLYIEEAFDVSRFFLRLLSLVIEGSAFFLLYGLFVWLFRMEEVAILRELLMRTKGERKESTSMPLMGGG